MLSPILTLTLTLTDDPITHEQRDMNLYPGERKALRSLKFINNRGRMGGHLTDLKNIAVCQE
jgi:hypothetical protein